MHRLDRVDVESFGNVCSCLLIGLQALAEIDRARSEVDALVQLAGDTERTRWLRQFGPHHPTGMFGEGLHFADALMFVGALSNSAAATPVSGLRGRVRTGAESRETAKEDA